MLFLLNNPVIAFLLLVVVGFMAYMTTKIIDEVKLNYDLSLKHQQMRIKEVAKGFKARITKLSMVTLSPIAVVIAVVIIGTSAPVIQTNNVLAISSASDIISIYNSFNEKLDSGYLDGIFSNRFIGAPEMEFDMMLDSYDLTTAYTSSSGSSDYSATNNQVIGVDEMDNVLTDGKYIYSMYDNKVQISLAYTLSLEEQALSLYKTFDYPVDYCSDDQFYPAGMFVDEDYFIVIGNQYSYSCVDEEFWGTEVDYIYRDWYWGYNQSSSIKVLVYDKENDFELKDEYTMNGYFTGTRKIDNSLYIVTNNYIPLYLEDVVVDDYISTYEVNGIEVSAKYEDIIYVDGTNPNSFTTFYGINLDTTEVDMETILGDSGYNLYVSNENMYLVGTTYYFWPMLDFIRVEEPVYESKTAIMKIAIGDSEVEYETLGLVSGYTLNQFSMDEYNGYLRITTTVGWWGSEINNRLYVLDENLVVVSVLEHLGKEGETIKSTRFAGDYAYLVTFQNTDPFYVINLSDPENPVVDGELLIPGFSTYLQPLGEDYMLGIGFGDSDGGTQGLKVSIYDISDKENPFEFDVVTFDYSDFGWSWSSATYNHKDLLVSISKGIIALPFSTYDYSSTTGYKYNSGILVYNFDFVDGLSLNGYVKHSEDSAENIYVYKSKFIDNFFYTVSNEYIKVSTIQDVETILKSIDLN